MLRKINLKGKTALVTGAGKGLGKACAIALAEAGAKVIVISRTKSDLIKVDKIIKKTIGSQSSKISSGSLCFIAPSYPPSISSRYF